MYIAISLPVFFTACQKSTGSEKSEETESASTPVAVSEVVQQKNYLLSPAEFKEKIANDGVVIIDVRTPGELVQLGKIKGAENIDFQGSGFKKQIEALDKNKEYYVYCHIGGRSGRTKKLMDDLGFKNVYDLKGGIQGWLAAGYEVVK